MTEIWHRWVDFWREEEEPQALALGRISFGLAVVANALWPIWAGNAVALYAAPEHGGVFGLGPSQLTLFALLPASAPVVHGLLAASALAGLALALGWRTRWMAAALVVLQITLTTRLGWFSFGADEVFRVFAFPMWLAPLGAAFSLDAWAGARARVPAWPRRLILFQITVIYVTTGLVKFGSTWTFLDGWSALYYALNIPSFARFDGAWAAWAYPLTQVATWLTRWWELGFFLLPLSMFFARHPDRGGRVRRWLARADLRPGMLGIGAALHLSLALTMDLGMFPWVMLALYPFFLRPEEAAALIALVQRREVADPAR